MTLHRCNAFHQFVENLSLAHRFSRSPALRSSFSPHRAIRRRTREDLLVGFLGRTPVNFDRTLEVRAVIDHDLCGRQSPITDPPFLISIFPVACTLPCTQPYTTTSRASMSAFSFAAVSTVDRKSTRLNSSHGYISYAVFC